MKQLILLAVLMPLTLSAQNENAEEVKDSVALNEVVVSASRVRSMTDRLRYSPDAKAKERSNNAYSLLNKLAMPNVKVDVAQRKITIPTLMGSLQIRINDVIATQQDLLALEPKSVSHVDLIQSPGARYGDDVGMVISIVTKRATEGYSVGVDELETLTSLNGSSNVFVRMNKGKSEFGLDYGFSFYDLKRGSLSETTRYLMPSGETCVVTRDEYDMRSQLLKNDLKLRYSIVDEGRYSFLATLSGSLNNQPKDNNKNREVVDGVAEDFNIDRKDRSSSPVLDLYLNVDLGRRQSFTAYATGTYVYSKYRYNYASAQPYAYSTHGRTWSLASEAVYENRLKPFTLSAGMLYNQSFVHNEYTGDASALNSIRTSDAYLFTSLTGKVGRLAYVAGAGVSRLYYRQGADSYEYWLLRPQLTLKYALPWDLSVKYNLLLADRAPRLEYLGEVETRTNSMGISLGNASLKPTRRIENRITLSLQKPAFSAGMIALYARNLHARMPQTYRRETEDGTCSFVTTQTNGGHIDHLFMTGYARWNVIQDHLSLNCETYLSRCFNYGPDYTHLYTGKNISAGLTSYLGRFTVTANVDNGWAFVEGESKQKNNWTWYGSVAYTVGNVSISLIWQNLFAAHPVINSQSYLNRYVNRDVVYRSADFGNTVQLNFTWNLSHGRKYNSAKNKRDIKAVDTGIRRVNDNKL